MKDKLKTNEIFRNFMLIGESPKDFIDYAKTYTLSMSKKKEKVIDGFDMKNWNLFWLFYKLNL